jgi:hypothetical protein
MSQSRKACLENLVGTKFGRLTVTAFECVANSQIIAMCNCDCGTPRKVNLISLRSGNTQSCGCLAKELRALNRKKICRFFKRNKGNETER